MMKKKLKKVNEFTDKEKANIEYNRIGISNKEIFLLVLDLYKKILPLLVVFCACVLIFASLFYFFY